jgi:CheY-like chemotaxis protein
MAQLLNWSLISVIGLFICLPWLGILLVPLVLLLSGPVGFAIWLWLRRGSQLKMAKKRKVLVVDDDPVSVAPVVQILSKRNAEVSFTESGLCALKMLEDQLFDFLVLDFALPDIDGTRILEEASGANNSFSPYRHRQTPVYFHTSSPEKVRELPLAHVNDFFVKEVIRKGASLAQLRDSFEPEFHRLGSGL